MPRGVTVTWRLAAEFAALQAGGRRRSFAPESPGMARPVRLAVGACVAHALPLPLPPFDDLPGLATSNQLPPPADALAAVIPTAEVGGALPAMR